MGGLLLTLNDGEDLMGSSIRKKIFRRLQKWRVRWYRMMLSEHRGKAWEGLHAAQPVQINGEGAVTIGDPSNKVVFGWNRSPGYHTGYCYVEARFPRANITIGGGTFFNNCCTVIANSTSIEFGRNCRIGYGCSFFDSDFHGIHPEDRDLPGDKLPDAPVKIGDDVFIGSNVTVLKGVSIGNGCVIGAGSVVSKSIPPMMVAAGNPCRGIKEIPNHE